MDLDAAQERASTATKRAARLLWTLHAAPSLFAGGGDGVSSGAPGSSSARSRPGQPPRPHPEQLGLMWSVVAEHILPGVAEGLVRASYYPCIRQPGKHTAALFRPATAVLLWCRLLLTTLHWAQAAAATADAGAGGSSVRASDAILWRRLLLHDMDLFSLLANGVAFIQQDKQQPHTMAQGFTYGDGCGEDEHLFTLQRAAAELYSTAVLAAAVLPHECATAAAVPQQGTSTGSAAAAGAQPPPSRYRVPLPVDSIAQLFGPEGPCPNPDWQAAVRQAFASASAAQDGHDQQQQACMTHARAAVQQQPQAQQMQTAAALMVPPGHVRSALRRRYPDRRLWLCDNPVCVPAPELDASGWPLPPESCACAGSWAWCSGCECECSLYCSVM
ncbi:hypothetical protein HYH02_012133 [Chlamydomonas schloesseri]|uniref:Uncharacterized protein n=1 Tax=Chlamydomonas schloesseri TaxID=2026947 RepID=A0A835W0P4_9CHLO|nr:hypothetical protein HYH02_012133 [Chlamydomonas schloesseri]|eukprot:KAG2434935.1 hypothetical protein HYH02_012133 [Chlamydomonas schloesseri]